MVFGLLNPLPDYAQSFFQCLSCFFAIGTLESHGVDGNVSNWRLKTRADRKNPTTAKDKHLAEDQSWIGDFGCVAAFGIGARGRNRL